MNTQFIFFSGKGGVGKTSMACATAVYHADQGHKTLIVTTDPASNLADVFEQPIGHRITPIDNVPHLWAMEIDPDRATEEYKDRALAPVRALFPPEVVQVMEEQLSGPCTAEVAAFDRFVDFLDVGNPQLVGEFNSPANTGGWEVVIFDTAPTGHTLRLLELPVDWSQQLEIKTYASAELSQAAEKARRLVQVDYEPLPVVTDPREAMRPGVPLVHDERGDTNVLRYIKIRKSDVEAGFARADAIVEGTYITLCVEHAYLQPEVGLGYIDEQGRVTVICATQWPYDDVHQIAHILNLPQEQIHEIVPAVGGAFGGREDMFIQHLLALAAYLLRRPVKMAFSREESLTRTGKRHPFSLRHHWGATRDGKLTAVEIEAVADAGACASTSGVVLANAVTFLAGPYVVPNARIDGYAVYTNNAMTMAMRGFGATQPPVAYE